MRCAILLSLMVMMLIGNAFSIEYRSELFLDQIHHSQDTVYQKIILHYDSLIRNKPKAEYHLEKCKFIESAFYDPEYEENPKQASWDTCYQSLLAQYPRDIRIAAYHVSHLYGDSVLVYGELAIERNKSIQKNPWENVSLASIYQSLGYAYSSKDSSKRALSAFNAAIRLNDTVNLALPIAQQWISLGNKAKARESLLAGEARLSPWQNNQAAKILLDHGFALDAERLYRKALVDTNLYVDFIGLAKSLENQGKIDSARKYNSLALKKDYNKTQAAKRQFEFDLKYSNGKVAMEAYRVFRNEGISVDPFSFYRMRLFVRHPGLPIAIQDLVGFSFLCLALAILFAAPYLWILPLYFIGTRWKLNRYATKQAHFSLKHLWLFNAILFITQFLATGFFQHSSIDETFGITSYLSLQDSSTNWQNTAFLIFFTGLNGIFTLWFCIRNQASFLFKMEGNPLRILGLVVGALVVFLSVKQINFHFFPELLQETKTEILNGSILIFMKSSLATLGLIPTLLIVSVLVPFYEEVLFRGLFTDAVGKYFPFWIVNGIQAFAFASMHGSLKLMPTFFVMGLMLGWLARKTGGLTIPMVLHCLNNFMAVTLLWLAMGKLARLH